MTTVSAETIVFKVNSLMHKSRGVHISFRSNEIFGKRNLVSLSELLRKLRYVKAKKKTKLNVVGFCILLLESRHFNSVFIKYDARRKLKHYARAAKARHRYDQRQRERQAAQELERRRHAGAR